MVNEDYRPDAVEDAVMTVLRRENRATPYLIREETEDLSKQEIGHALSSLAAAGWVSKRTRGLYDYVEDPRLEGGEAEPEEDLGGVGHDRARELIDSWEPSDQVNTQRAREDARELIAFLSRHDAPQSKSDFMTWAETNCYYSPSTLWGNVAQPLFSYLAEEDVVEFTANKGYEIVDGE